MLLFQSITLLLTGFSVISAVLLAITHFSCSEYKGNFLPRLAGLTLLSCLAAIQLFHFRFLNKDAYWVNSNMYLFLLFIVAPAFYFFSRDLLKVKNSYHPLLSLHALPLFSILLLPRNYSLILVFMIGTGYVFWLIKIVYQLREQRKRFKLELIALAAMSLVAIMVLLLGVAIPIINQSFFYTSYAFLIGLTFVIAVFTLLSFPQITQEVSEAAHASYASSTLKNVNSSALSSRLKQLMEADNLYTNENLSLNHLAEHLELSSHQLSEFINTHFNKSFSQFIREYRIKAATEMLVNEPKASVLSIGLSVGFTSQSNFYTAFSDIMGMPPGSYRKQKTNKKL